MTISFDQLQAIISAFNLNVTNRKDGNDEVRGNLEGREVLITVFYNTNTVVFMDYLDYSSVTKQLV